MLPIKIKNEDFLLSNASLFSLVDKATQTESKCVSEQGSNAINIDPNTTETEVENLLDYCQTLSESGIFNTKIRIENIKHHKQGVVSAKSSHGTFLLGNIFQKEDLVEPHSTTIPAWTLDERFDKEFSNSGYIYIPSAEGSTQEYVPNKACVFLPNQETCLAEKNNDEDAKSNPIKQASFHSKISKEKVSAHVSVISNPIELINIDTEESTKEMAGKKASNEEACPSPSELRARRLNYIAQEIKTCLSTTLSVIMDPICDGVCKSKGLKIGEACAEDTAAEKKVEKPPEVASPKTGIISRIKKSFSNLVCDPCPACEAKPIEPPQAEPPPPPEEEKKEEIKPRCSPNKHSGPVISHPCSPPRPRNCGYGKESGHSLEFKPISLLINTMSPNNEFVSEEYVFNNNDHPSPINIDMSADRKSEHVAISKPSVDDVTKLSAATSSIKYDDYIHSKPENISMMKDNTIEAHTNNHNGPVAIIMDAVESTVASLKEHIDLDRISTIKKEVTKAPGKVVESRNPSSEYFIRAVAPEAMNQTHQFVPPPKSLFTSFKSTISRFFGDGERIEPDISSSSASETSSVMTDESTYEESDPQT